MNRSHRRANEITRLEVDPIGGCGSEATGVRSGHWAWLGAGLFALLAFGGGCDSNPTPHPIGPDAMLDTEPPGRETDRPETNEGSPDDPANLDGDPAAGLSDAVGGDCGRDGWEADVGDDGGDARDAGPHDASDGCSGDGGATPSAPAADEGRGSADFGGSPEPIGGRAGRR